MADGKKAPLKTGRQRLIKAFGPSVSRGRMVVGLLLAILGFLAIVQIQTLDDDTEFAGARREDLITFLDTLEAASRSAQSDIDNLEARRDSLRDASDRRSAAINEAEQQAEALGVLAGTAPATGPGVIVTINDPGDDVTGGTLLNALEEMRNAGAEAIEVNNKVRVVAQTSLVDTEGGVAAGGVELGSPYVFEVIGPPDDLETAMSFPGGLTDEVEELQGTVAIKRSDDINIASLHRPETPEYARPAN
ncbi:MAG: DUF881 domain-containing protein [Nocardioidaceae bacterium]